VPRQHHALHTLDLSHNTVGAATASAIAALLLSNCSSSASGETSAARTLSKAVAHSSTTSSSSSSSSNSSSRAAVAVKRTHHKGGKATACTCSLTALDLCHNRLGDPGAAALFTALQQHKPPALTRLALAHNSISKASICERIGPLLAVGLALTHLDLSGNCLGAECAAEISAALAWNCSLRRVELQGNSFAAAAVMFAAALQHNSVLTELNLSSNGVTGSAAVAMAQASTNVTLFVCSSYACCELL
jgi:Ran GTPase-activating protein (RanGAP) involved in mRNA processing and transport